MANSLFIVPEDSPFNVQVTGNSPSSVLVSWTPPSTSNGIITSYKLYVDHNDGSPMSVIQSSSNSTNYTVTSLDPYQAISVHISATTSAGEGPASETVTGRSRELGTLNSLVET